MTKPGSSKPHCRHSVLSSAVVGIAQPVAGPGVCYSDLHVQGDIPQTTGLLLLWGKTVFLKMLFVSKNNNW